MLVIRLRRTGKKKKPSFRVVVAEETMPIYGRFVDIIGNINLQSDPKVINIDKEKALDWMKKGAKPSHTVARLMVKQGILKEEDVKMKPEKKRPKKKEQKKETSDKKQETREDKEKIKETPAPAEKSEQKPEEAKEEVKEEIKEAPTPAEGEAGVPTESVGKKAENKELEVKQETEVKPEEKTETPKEEKPEEPKKNEPSAEKENKPKESSEGGQPTADHLDSAKASTDEPQGEKPESETAK